MTSNTLLVGWIIMLLVGIQRFVASIMLYTSGEKGLDSCVLFALHGISIVFITLGSYKKGETWSWWCLFVLGFTVPIYCIFAHGVSAWPIIGLVLFVPAILIPIKDFLGKKTG
jgi:hypothetical protein